MSKDVDQRSEPKKRSWPGTAIRILLAALLVYLLWGLIAAIDWTKVTQAIADLSGAQWAALIAVSAARIAAEAWVLAAVMPGLRFGHALQGFLAPSAAASVIPGPADLVARFGMYRSWGFSNTETSASVMTSWVFTTGAKIALPVMAAIAMAVANRRNADLEFVAVVAAGILVAAGLVLSVVLRSEALARRLGRAAGRTAIRLAKPFRINVADHLAESLSDQMAHFRSTVGVIIRKRWHVASVAALASQVLQFGILLVSMRAVGISSDELHWVEIFAAFALVQLITSIPITPGGVGIAEAAYVTLLVTGSDLPLTDAVTAATLIYRVFSWIIIIPLGGLAWLWWGRVQNDGDQAEEPTPNERAP